MPLSKKPKYSQGSTPGFRPHATKCTCFTKAKKKKGQIGKTKLKLLLLSFPLQLRLQLQIRVWWRKLGNFRASRPLQASNPFAMSSGDLISVEPQELRFPCQFSLLLKSSSFFFCLVCFLGFGFWIFLDSWFRIWEVELKKQISCSLQLSNKTDNYVAFKVIFTSSSSSHYFLFFAL